VESTEKKNFLKLVFFTSLGGVGFSFFQAFKSFSLIFLISKFLTSKTEIGFLLSLGSFVGIVIPPVIGYISDRLKWILKGRKIIIIFSLLILAILFNRFEKINSSQELYLFLTLIYIFFYAGFSPYQSLVPDLFPKGMLASATGIINFISQAFQGVYIFIVVIAHASNLTFKLIIWGFLISIIFLLFISEKNEGEERNKNTIDLNFFHNKLWIKLFLLQFFVWYGISSVSSFLLLFFQDALSASLSDYMVVLAIYGIITALSTFGAGFLADRFSKEKISALSLGLLGISSFMYSQTYRIQHALFSSILYGVSLGSLSVVPYSLILSYIPKDKAGSFVGVNTLVISISQVIAYFTSGLLIDLGGYRLNFLQGLVAAILGLILMRSMNNQK